VVVETKDLRPGTKLSLNAPSACWRDTKEKEKEGMENVEKNAFNSVIGDGIRMDVHYDEKGDIDRENFLVKIEDGKPVITGVLPPLHPESFETCKK
jgi:hypothetical protein